jgi:hypothetical protein
MVLMRGTRMAGGFCSTITGVEALIGFLLEVLEGVLGTALILIG